MKPAQRKQSTLATDLRVRGSGSIAFASGAGADTWDALSMTPVRTGGSKVNYTTL